MLNNTIKTIYRNFSLKMKVDKVAAVVKIFDSNAVKLAANFISNEEIIAVPTDTVYGLACSAKSLNAVKKLYEIKGRDESKPVAICVGSLDEFRKWGHSEHLEEELLKKLLPGPITIVLKQTPILNNPYLNPSTDKIGIRIPNSKFVCEVASIFGGPIALTSANPSSVPSSLDIREFDCLHSKLAAVFDGGILGDGSQKTRVGSTVVDLSEEGYYHVIRDGIAHDHIVNLLETYKIKKTC